MAKKKSSPVAPSESHPLVVDKPYIPKDLQDQLSAIRALAATHDLISKGSFNVSKLGQVEQSILFLQSLHAQCIEQALAHPSANEVPELVEVQSQRSK
jgi:hypothetical protein